MNISELCAIHGVANVRITMFESPLEVLFIGGPVLFYTSGDSLQVEVEFQISEERYRVSDGFMVGFLPTYHDDTLYSPKPMYQSDLNSMLREGHASVRVLNMERIEVSGRTQLSVDV